jgi:hypothetical protein
VCNLLGDVLAGRSDTADREEDVVVKEVASEALDLNGEGGREEQRDAFTGLGHGVLLNNATDLRLKAHVKHAISLVQNKEPVEE